MAAHSYHFRSISVFGNISLIFANKQKFTNKNKLLNIDEVNMWSISDIEHIRNDVLTNCRSLLAMLEPWKLLGISNNRQNGIETDIFTWIWNRAAEETGKRIWKLWFERRIANNEYKWYLNDW